MNATQKENLGLELEQIVDKWGLKHVVETLSEIAFDKATHIAENWQDIQLAKIWTKRGNIIHKASEQIEAD